MKKIPTPMDRRRFMKHIGILGIAGVMSMSIGEIFSPNESDLIDAAAQTEIANNRKIIWTSKSKAEIGDTADPDATTTELVSGGFPIVNRAACSYHLQNPQTGEYDPISRKNENQFCKGPCVDVCPVDAIRLRKNVDGKTMSGFPQIDRTDLQKDWGDPDYGTGCIGCQKCFKMCGYDAIQWVNP
jgi:ferredoxin